MFSAFFVALKKLSPRESKPGNGTLEYKMSTLRLNCVPFLYSLFALYDPSIRSERIEELESFLLSLRIKLAGRWNVVYRRWSSILSLFASQKIHKPKNQRLIIKYGSWKWNNFFGVKSSGKIARQFPIHSKCSKKHWSWKYTFIHPLMLSAHVITITRIEPFYFPIVVGQHLQKHSQIFQMIWLLCCLIWVKADNTNKMGRGITQLEELNQLTVKTIKNGQFFLNILCEKTSFNFNKYNVIKHLLAS